MKISDPTAIRRYSLIRPEIDFTFSPEGTALSWNIGVDTFAPPDTFAITTNTEITFTATATMPPRFSPTSSFGDRPPNAEVVEYFWTFGDGHTGYGNPVAHTYHVPNATVPITLRITDDQGRIYAIQKHKYIVVSSHLYPSNTLFPSDALFPGT